MTYFLTEKLNLINKGKNMKYSEEAKKNTIQEWRDLGFYYETDDVNKKWIIKGDKKGLLSFVSFLISYSKDKKLDKISEHKHYGPYDYLKFITWDEALIQHDGIYGKLRDFIMLADLVNTKLSENISENKFSIKNEYSENSLYALEFIIENDGFDPSSADCNLQ